MKPEAVRETRAKRVMFAPLQGGCAPIGGQSCSEAAGMLCAKYCYASSYWVGLRVEKNSCMACTGPQVSSSGLSMVVGVGPVLFFFQRR